MGRAVHLDHRVVAGGGAVHHDVELVAELGQRHAEVLSELAQAVHHAARLIVERRWRLVEHHVAISGDADQVGKGAADVDTHAVARHGVASFLRMSARSVVVAGSLIASVRSSSEPVNTTP